MKTTLRTTVLYCLFYLCLPRSRRFSGPKKVEGPSIKTNTRLSTVRKVGIFFLLKIMYSAVWWYSRCALKNLTVRLVRFFVCNDAS